MGINFPHRHQTEIIGDKGHQSFLGQYQRVFLENGTLFRLFDMLIQHTQTAVLHHFQQFIQAHQQLTLELRPHFLFADHAFDLVSNLFKHMHWVTDNHRPQTGPHDNNNFCRLPDSN